MSVERVTVSSRARWGVSIAVTLAAALLFARPRSATSAVAPLAEAPAPTTATPARLARGKPSLDELGRALVAAVAANDRAALEALTPSFDDYASLIYPELVKAGEPLIGSMGPRWAWDNLGHASRKDLKRLLDERGGEALVFESIAAGPAQRRGALSVLPTVVVRAKDRRGRVLEIRAIFAIVERGGSFEILRFRPDRT
ncbi:MAG: hypothetical protein HYV09_13435 [Deltaproteobacteria bacterium]|nr:hypothetical protein [Deltaproteobacteria bacterium]